MVVDVDLSKFFDRVNHDILMDRLQVRIADVQMLRLIRAYLNTGIRAAVMWLAPVAWRNLLKMPVLGEKASAKGLHPARADAPSLVMAELIKVKSTGA